MHQIICSHIVCVYHLVYLVFQALEIKVADALPLGPTSHFHETKMTQRCCSAFMLVAKSLTVLLYSQYKWLNLYIPKIQIFKYETCQVQPQPSVADPRAVLL